MLRVGEVLVADGHTLDFQVINPFTGKPCRATLVGFQDWKSGALAGFEIMVTENTQCIHSALRNAIINLGKIPDYVILDNGKAFKSKFFKGSRDFEEDGIIGLYAALGITTVFANPYNARSKKIERFFKTFSNSFEKLLPSYTGNNIANKPAWMHRNEKLHKKLHNEWIPTIEEAKTLINWWIENYYNKEECPLEKGTSIGEVFENGKGTGINVNELDELMLAKKIVSVRRNGIRFLGADYWAEELYGYDDKVIIRYSLYDLSSIRVYTLRNEYICTAVTEKSCHILAPYMGDTFDMENLKQALKRQKKLEDKTVIRTYGNIRKTKGSKNNKWLEIPEADDIKELESKEIIDMRQKRNERLKKEYQMYKEQGWL